MRKDEIIQVAVDALFKVKGPGTSVHAVAKKTGLPTTGVHEALVAARDMGCVHETFTKKGTPIYRIA